MSSAIPTWCGVTAAAGRVSEPHSRCRSAEPRTAVPKAFVGLKAATPTFHKDQPSALTTSNGCNTTAMMVWTPVNNKFFETFSFLPPLSDPELAAQVDHIMRNGWTPTVEFSPPETATTGNHGSDGIQSASASGYYANRYWTMWKLPMFGCSNASQVLAEIAACKQAFPECYIRIASFDPIQQVQATSMLVHRPPTAAALPVHARSVDGSLASPPDAAPRSPPPRPADVSVAPAPAPADASAEPTTAPLSYFALDKLTPKGRRKNVDVGDPHDFTRKLASLAGASVGSWACSEGGWDSPTPRPSTETFLVLSGEGCVTDPDGERHPFGAGDVVILPKHWWGRWDIYKHIHKVWVVHTHPDVQGASPTPRVFPLREVSPGGGVDPWAAYGMSSTSEDPAVTSPAATTNYPMYSVGNTAVGYSAYARGTRPVVKQPATECFHVLEGTVILTSENGTSQRCGAGATVMIPKGWSGQQQNIGLVKKVWVEISD